MSAPSTRTRQTPGRCTGLSLGVNSSKPSKNGITEVWELAEYFDVTEDFMRWAIAYYTERKNYKFE